MLSVVAINMVEYLVSFFWLSMLADKAGSQKPAMIFRVIVKID